MIDRNGKEVLKELYEHHKAYLRYQQQLLDKFQLFYCAECEELHNLEVKQKNLFICVKQHKEKEKLRLREYRNRKKIETLAV